MIEHANACGLKPELRAVFDIAHWNQIVTGRLLRVYRGRSIQPSNTGATIPEHNPEIPILSVRRPSPVTSMKGL